MRITVDIRSLNIPQIFSATAEGLCKFKGFPTSQMGIPVGIYEYYKYRATVAIVSPEMELIVRFNIDRIHAVNGPLFHLRFSYICIQKALNSRIPTRLECCV